MIKLHIKTTDGIDIEITDENPTDAVAMLFLTLDKVNKRYEEESIEVIKYEVQHKGLYINTAISALCKVSNQLTEEKAREMILNWNKEIA